MVKPRFKHDNSTREGRIERAVAILKDGEKRGLPVAVALGFLADKGCSDDELTEALNEASGGELVRAATG